MTVKTGAMVDDNSATFQGTDILRIASLYLTIFTF